jgi:hypothetical protein
MADCNVLFESLRTGTAHADSNCKIKTKKQQALDPLLGIKQSEVKKSNLELGSPY